MKRYPGVVTGIVKNLDDPAGQGRIELQFPWLSDSLRSSWAPVASALAGKERGAFLMPEIDDEVLVAFEHGDINHPFILGFLWNGVDTPPETTNQNRVIKTPGGHQLRFEDTAGAKKVILKSNGGHEIEINDTVETITMKTKSGNQIIVLNDAVKSVTVRGGGRMVEMVGGQILMT
ncbi:MAG: phage tail protein [Acidobacteria bacterium]|nr:MAG: phage tail protein [Acidobacteriota bacterium]